MTALYTYNALICWSSLNKFERIKLITSTMDGWERHVRSSPDQFGLFLLLIQSRLWSSSKSNLFVHIVLTICGVIKCKVSASIWFPDKLWHLTLCSDIYVTEIVVAVSKGKSREPRHNNYYLIIFSCTSSYSVFICHILCIFAFVKCTKIVCVNQCLAFKKFPLADRFCSVAVGLPSTTMND